MLLKTVQKSSAFLESESDDQVADVKGNRIPLSQSGNQQSTLDSSSTRIKKNQLVNNQLQVTKVEVSVEGEEEVLEEDLVNPDTNLPSSATWKDPPNAHGI